MIKINKTTTVPTILTTTGATETANLIHAYNANPVQFTSGGGIPVRRLTKMVFDNRIYGDQTVKTQLISEQHEKCCFCEAKFTDNSFGDVEHFRPKKAYKKRGARSLIYPGYYWLAYDWANLLFSCEVCNRRHKRNDFPLGNETTRKANHAHTNALTNEDRLLINPIVEDPSLFITFREEVPVAVNGNLKGSESIRVFGLERMNDTRLDYLLLLGGLLAFHEIDITDNVQVQLAMGMFKISRQEILAKVADANRFFNSVAKDTSKFAHCVRCKFPTLPTV